MNSNLFAAGGYIRMPESSSILLHFRFTSRLNLRECSTTRRDGARGENEAAEL